MGMSREGYYRIVLFQERTGYVVDLDPRKMIPNNFGKPSQDIVTIQANGQDQIRGRNSIWPLPMVDMEISAHLGLISNNALAGCPVKAIGFGFKKHSVWLEDASFILNPYRPGRPGFASDVFTMKTGIRLPSIYEGENLIGGIPWRCTESTDFALPGSGAGSGSGGSIIVLSSAELSGYQGPFFEVAGGETVDIYGAYAGAGATLEFIAPIGESSLRLDGDVTATLSAIAFDGVTVLASAVQGVSLDIPYRTWLLRIEITASNESPFLTVVDSGSIQTPRVGVCLNCGDPDAVIATDPLWTGGGGPVSPYNKIVYTIQASGLWQADRDGANPQQIYLTSDTGLRHVGGYDPLLDRIWFIRTSRASSIHPDGTGLVTAEDNVTNESGMYVDTVLGICFLTRQNTTFHEIKYKALSNGGGVGNFTTLYNLGNTDPEGITVDNDTEVLYWGESTDDDIEKGDVTFSVPSRVTVLNYGNAVGGVALDQDNGYLYFIDSDNGKIMRCDTDGSNVTEILTGKSFWSQSQLDIDVYEGKLYYAETPANRIGRCDLNGDNDETIISGASGIIYGIRLCTLP